MAQGSSFLPSIQSQNTPVPQPLSSSILPSQSAGSFINQRLGGLVTGTSAQTGGAQSDRSVGSVQSVQTPDGTDPMAAAQNMSDRIQSTNDNLMSLAQASGAKRRAAQQSQTGAGGSTAAGGNYSGAPAGQAYTPNGSLSASRNQALKTASSYLGNRYVLGGTSHQGIDCSGLVMMVYDQFGYGKYLNSHLAGHQAAAIPGVRTTLDKLRPGDLVAWRDGSHIAIWAGNGQIIEAANERVGTVRRRLWASPSQVFGIALRLPGE